jgi:hypothetical protein
MQIQSFSTLAVATLSAALAPAAIVAVVALWQAPDLSFSFATWTFAFALAHTVLFGLPLYAIGARWGGVNFITAPVVGFLVGVLPIGLLTWPLRYPELHATASVGGVMTEIDGVPTMAGWLFYANGAATMGLFGTAGGIAFWAALRLLGASRDTKQGGMP